MTLPESRRRVTGLRTGAVISMMTALVLGLGIARAATLGSGTSQKLAVYDVNQQPVIPTTTTTIPPTTTTTIPPTTTTTLPPTTTTTVLPPARMITCDNFSTPSNSNGLDGRFVRPAALCGGGQWKVYAGNWSMAQGQVSGGNDPAASAAINVGSTSVSLETQIRNTGNNPGGAGLAISHTGDPRTMVAGVLSGPNQVQIRLVNKQTFTVLATASVPLGNNVKLRLTRIANTITLTVDGTVRLTVTLTAAQAATVNGTFAGLYVGAQSSPVTFTSFQVTTPSLP